MKKYLQILTKVLVYLTFAMPLIVFTSYFIFPFIVPKIIYFRSLVTIMSASYILLLVINWSEFKFKKSPMNIIFAIYLIGFAISTFLGLDAYHSFWDNHERMLGLFTIIHYVIYYFIATSIFKTWCDWKWVLRIFLMFGSIAMFLGLMQVGNPDFLVNRTDNRISSTLGNPIYVGGYGLFMVAAAFLLIMRGKNDFWRWIDMAMGILGLLGLYYSGTRGAVLGLVAGICTASFCYILVLKGRKKIKMVLIGLLALILLSLGGMYIKRDTEFVDSIPGVGRLVNLSLTELKNSPRWMAWGIAYTGWKESPLFGHGPNNFFYIFNKHYNPRLLEHGYGETWFDNAHNMVANTMATQGAVGTLAYLGLFVSAILMLWIRYYRNKLNKHLVVIGTSFLVAHLLSIITVFENLTSYLYLFIWLAMINSLTSKPDEAVKEDDRIVRNKEVGAFSLTAAGLVVLIIIIIFNFSPAKANINTLTAIRSFGNVTKSSNPVEAFDQSYTMIKQVLESNSPHIDDIRSDTTRHVSGMISELYKVAGPEKTNALVDLLYEHQSKNIELHPLDVRNYFTLAQLSRVKYQLTKDNKYNLQSEKIMEEALKKSPKRQQIIYNLAGQKMSNGKLDEAVALSKQVLADNPRIAESYWRLAVAYQGAGKMDEAKKIVKEAYAKGMSFSTAEVNLLKSINVISTNTTNTVTNK